MQLVISKTTLNHTPTHIMKNNIWGGVKLFLFMLSLLSTVEMKAQSFENCSMPNGVSSIVPFVNKRNLNHVDGCDNFNLNNGTLPVTGCNNYRNYAPFRPNETPIKTLRLVFHVFQKDDGTVNFQNTPVDIARIDQVVNRVNFLYQNNLAPDQPVSSCAYFSLPKNF